MTGDQQQPNSPPSMMGGLVNALRQKPPVDLEPVTVAVVRRLDDLAALLGQSLALQSVQAAALQRIAASAEEATGILKAARDEAAR